MSAAPKLNIARWKRFFSVPCALMDDYIKLADEASLKLLLYMLYSESEDIDKTEVSRKLGIKEQGYDDAVLFWRELGVLESEDGSDSISVKTVSDSSPKSQQVSAVQASPANPKVRISYTPKTISELIDRDSLTQELFSEAEQTLGRLLKHAEQELLINLREYYGFSTQSIILILEYCLSVGKTSAARIEAVASEFVRDGITEFSEIDSEIKKRSEYHTFENEVRRAIFLETKPTAKQAKFISSWKELGFSVQMIAEARERCVDQTNKLSFPYINKILQSWAEKKLFTPEALEADEANKTRPANKPAESGESSFDLDEFDSFTLEQYKVK